MHCTNNLFVLFLGFAAMVLVHAKGVEVKSPSAEDVVQATAAAEARVRQQFSEIAHYMNAEIGRIDQVRKDLRVKHGLEEPEER